MKGQQKWQERQINNQQKQMNIQEDKKNWYEMSFTLATPLTEIEIKKLIHQWEDEYAAIWIYQYFYELYELDVFQNIANSEKKHLEVIEKLMTAYWLDIPKWLSDEFLAEVETLKAMWESSLKWALEAWVLFEIRDIEDITKAIIASDNEDIRKVMLNIGGGSFNHLRGFLNNLEKQGFTTDIDYSEFLTEADLEEKWLKDRFVIYLENRWIDIDASLLNQKDSSEKWGKEWNKWQAKQIWKDQDIRNNQSAAKEKYKNEIRSIIWNRLTSFSTERLDSIQKNINIMRESIKNSNIESSIKHNYMAILWALEDIINEIR